MRRLLTAAGIGLATLPAAAQLPPDVWFSPCDGPMATCVSPRAGHLLNYALVSDLPSSRSLPCRPIRHLTGADRPVIAAPAGPGVIDALAFYEPPLTPIADDAREILGRWELASQAHLPVTEAERLRLRYGAPERSGQELALTCELQGPVDADILAKRYDWTVTDDADAVELTAVPKDELERLFYDRFTVTLDAATWRPVSLRFVTPDEDRGTAVALRPWIDAAATDIRLVGYEPSDETDRPIRTADLSDDSPRLLRDDATLDLPPAPAPCEFDEPVEAPKPLPPAEPAALREVLEKYDRYVGANRLRLELRRRQYDAAFEIETTSRVSLFLEGHRLGWLESHPPEAAWAEAPVRVGFEPMPCPPDGWRWEADRITMYDPASNSADQVFVLPDAPAPSSDWGWLTEYFPIFGDPSRLLPVWADRSVASLRTRYELTLVLHPDPTAVCVIATPRTGDEVPMFQRIDILFDRETGRPRATRTFDPSGNRETVLTAVEMSLNGPRPPVKALKPRPPR